MTIAPATTSLADLAPLANRIRRDSLEATTAAGSGHPTSCFSCAELVAVLFFHAMRYDIERPTDPRNDRFVLSKGHAAPALWSALKEAGAISEDELLSLRRIDSRIEGHPTARSPFVDVPTGSLGQGLSMGLGMAMWSRRLGVDNRVWVLLGDGECAEGSVWEAAMLAGHEGMERLCAVIDVNRLGQTGETMDGHDCAVYQQRFRAFGWNTMMIDGHDIPSIVAAFDRVPEMDGPTAIIARTVKGKGVRFLEGVNGRHGQALSGEEARRAREELGWDTGIGEAIIRPPVGHALPALRCLDGDLPDPDWSQAMATRHAFGEALAAAMDVDDRLVVYDAEVANSTGVDRARERHSQRCVECYIAEQNMVGMALGAASLGAIPCLSTFAAFLTRAADQLRMAGQSGHHLVVAGSHAGISIGADGPSQMGLEDVALFRAINDAVVLAPADAVSCYHLLPAAIAEPGLVYLRLTRPERSLIYSVRDRDFHPGGSRLLRIGPADRAVVVASGVCVHEAIEAADVLAAEGIGLRVIDAYSIAPLDIDSIAGAAAETGHLIVIEDHHPAGGLGEAIAAQVLPRVPGTLFDHLAVRGLPRSGSAAALMRRHQIDAQAVMDTVRRAVPTGS